MARCRAAINLDFPSATSHLLGDVADIVSGPLWNPWYMGRVYPDEITAEFYRQQRKGKQDRSLKNRGNPAAHAAS